MKTSHRVLELLFEAYRRNQMLDPHKNAQPILDRWLGLGTYSAYKPALDAGMMVFCHRKPQPRCAGWLHLTALGEKTMNEHATEFKDVLAILEENGYNNSVRANFMLAGELYTEED